MLVYTVLAEIVPLSLSAISHFMGNVPYLAALTFSLCVL